MSAPGNRNAQLLNRTAILLIVLASYFMIVTDISIVITALSKIKQGLGFS